MLFLMNLVAQLVGLMVEFPGFLTGDLAVVLKSLRLSLLDLIELTFKVGCLLAGQLSLGDTLIDPFFQIGFPAINSVLMRFRAMTLPRRGGIRALRTAGKNCQSGKDREEVMCFHFKWKNPAMPEKLHEIL